MDGADTFPHSPRFAFRKRLGEGGFGIVYEVDDRERGMRVALKTLRHLDATALYALKREFRALCDVVHPNLIGLHELISEGDRWFFTMDLVEGSDFFTYVRSSPALAAASTVLAPLADSQDPSTPASGGLSARGTSTHGASTDDLASMVAARDDDARKTIIDPERWIRLRSAMRQLTEGLCALHSAGKLHRDLKPSNVLVTRAGKIVILDFGIVMDASADPAHPTFGHMAGTPAYMSAQQGFGEPATSADDWYSVGVMLYEALTGRLPFDGTPLQILARKQREDPPPPSAVASGVPRDLEELCLALLARIPEERPSAADVLKRLAVPCTNGAPATREVTGAEMAISRRPSGPDTVPFIGRETHLAVLRDSLQHTRRGHATIVHVRGVSGMGKSVLVRYFLDELANDSQVVALQGRCYEREAVPYKAIDNLIDSLSRYLSHLPKSRATELMPRDAHALIRLFPVLARVQAVAAAPGRGPLPPDAQELRRRGFAALRELFGRIADRQPLLIHIDDLQWGDADSALLLGELVREPDPPPLLLLIGYRSEDADKSEMLRRLPTSIATAAGGAAASRSDAAAVRDLAVGPLDEDEARDLARHVLRGAGTAEQLDAVVKEAAGSPFFVQELALAVREHGHAAGEEIRLETVLSNRLSRLTVEARRLLETVAVAGKPVARRVAREAAALSAEQEQSAIGLLRADHVLRLRGTGSDEELETFHDRIRETAVAQIPTKDLARRHLQLANALEAAGTAEPDMLAVHFRRGDRPDKAAPYAILAGDRAAEALAFDRAAALFAYALEAAPVDTEQERGLHIKLADALKNAGRGAAAAAEYFAAAKGAPQNQSLDLRRRAAEQLLISGHLDEGKRALRAVLAELGVRIFENRWLVLLSLLFWRLLIRLRGLRAPMRELSQVPATTLARLDALWSAAVGLVTSELIAGSEFLARYLWLALRQGSTKHLGCGLAMEVSVLAVRGSGGLARTLSVHQQAAALAASVDDPYLLALSKWGLGGAACFSGRWAESVEQSRAAIELWTAKSTGVAWEIGTARIVMLGGMWFRGQMKELLRLALPLAEDASTRGDLLALTWFRMCYGYWSRLSDDQPQAARDYVDRAIAQWSSRSFNGLHFYDMVVRGYIDIYADDPMAARERFRNRLPRLLWSLVLQVQLYRVTFYDARACAALGAAAAHAHDKSLFRTLVREAERDARRLARENAPWATALSTARHAALASLRQDHPAALSLLDLAISQLDACDMALYAAAARRRKGEIIGGDEGRSLIETADAWVAGQGLKNPSRITALFAPGFR